MALIAMLQALTDPEGTAGLILVAASASHRFMRDNAHNDPNRPRHGEFRAAQELSECDPALATQRLWRLSLADPAQPGIPDAAAIAESHSQERMMAFGQHVAEFDLEPELLHVRCPVSVIAGRWDPVCTVACSERTAASTPNAELRVFEHSGHMPFWEEPDLFRRTVTDWSQRHELTSHGI